MTTETPEQTASQAGEQTPSEAKPAEVGVKNYTDGYSYEVPRPFLTLEQAAAVLGKSLRSLERSLLGRWGNKLPDGWQARKMRIGVGDEWRIIPPPGFRVRQVLPGTTSDTAMAYNVEPPPPQQPEAPQSSGAPPEAAFPQRRRQAWRPERHTLSEPTIVIERTEEVEQLLRELVSTQKALSEERRLHIEDLRLITHLQSSLRLLETHSSEKEKLQTELTATQKELNQLKEQYSKLLATPWWRRLFLIQP